MRTLNDEIYDRHMAYEAELARSVESRLYGWGDEDVDTEIMSLQLAANGGRVVTSLYGSEVY